MIPKYQWNEAETRYNSINPLLKKAKWNLADRREVVKRAFQAFIRGHGYNADQTRFLRTVQTVFMQRCKLALDDLYEAPFLPILERARWRSCLMLGRLRKLLR